MSDPTWWSQPFPPTGAITSEGIRNQLGRPPVDPLTVFVRETAQNSWDARLRDGPTIYGLELLTIPAPARPNWVRLLTPVGEVAAHLRLGQVVRAPELRVLAVVDRGTKGLGGPTRADQVAETVRDWVSFVLNVGEKRDTAHGGGTYGYGKAVLYRLSKVGTILVHSRVRNTGGGLESRLIGIALGSSFSTSDPVGGRPFTGRHWWGRVQGDHVEPLVAEEADVVARSLGLPAFAGEETGTTLVVVDPDLDDFDDDESAARHLADTIAWQLWPIMLPERGEDRLVPHVRVRGVAVPVPDPATTHPLKMFVTAHRRLSRPGATTLVCKRPQRALGRFAVSKSVVTPLDEQEQTQAAAYAGVPGDPHHVCLMRSPELVVKYYEGPKPFSTNLAYAGVFRAVDELDEVLAASEPPTHDNWVHEQLTGVDKTYVRMIFQRMKEELGEFKRAAVTQTAAAAVPLGAASNFLGGLVAAALQEPLNLGGGTATSGGAAGGGARTGGNAGRSVSVARVGRVDVRHVGTPSVREHAGEVVVVQRVALTGEGRVELSAVLKVATADGREDEPPTGAEQPSVHSWHLDDRVSDGPRCDVDAPAELELWVRPARDTMTDVLVTAGKVDR
jgi:hypothetical protein